MDKRPPRGFLLSFAILEVFIASETGYLLEVCKFIRYTCRQKKHFRFGILVNSFYFPKCSKDDTNGPSISISRKDLRQTIFRRFFLGIFFKDSIISSEDLLFLIDILKVFFTDGRRFSEDIL